MTPDTLCTCRHPLSKHNREPGVDKLTGETVQHCHASTFTVHEVEASAFTGSYGFCRCRRFQPAAEVSDE